MLPFSISTGFAVFALAWNSPSHHKVERLAEGSRSADIHKWRGAVVFTQTGRKKGMALYNCELRGGVGG